MQRRVWIVLLAGLVAGAEKPDAEAVKKEWARLEGTWMLVTLELQGKSLLEQDKPAPQIVVKDGKVKAKDAPKDAPEELSTLKIDPSQEPKTITGTCENGKLTLLGIYAVEGDELRICVQVVETSRAKEREKERPKEFDSSKGVLLVFKRLGS